MALAAPWRAPASSWKMSLRTALPTRRSFGAMGADIFLSGRLAVVRGGRLYGAEVQASDLRERAALVIAALAAEGEKPRGERGMIDRGYEALETCLPPSARTYAGYDGGIPMRLTAQKKRKILALTALIARFGAGRISGARKRCVRRPRRALGGQCQHRRRYHHPRRAVAPGQAPARCQRGSGARIAGERRSGGAGQPGEIHPGQIVLNVRERVCEAVVSYAGVILSLERDGTVIQQWNALPQTDAVYVRPDRQRLRPAR